MMICSDPYVRISLYRGDREEGLIDTKQTRVVKKVLQPCRLDTLDALEHKAVQVC